MKLRLLVISCWLITPAAFAVIDTNSNGVSDLWEREHNARELFGGTFDPQADPDSDGWTNAQEAAAGTSPFDANPPDGMIRPIAAHTPAVWSEPDEYNEIYLISPEAVTVTWPTLVGKQYTLFFSPDLAQGSWIPVGDPFIAYGGDVTYGFEISQSDKCFWRVTATDFDSDYDGLSNYEEISAGTNAYLADSDSDTLSDWQEFMASTHPLNQDTDGDGIPDPIDTEPLIKAFAFADADGDGIPDADDAAPNDPRGLAPIIASENTSGNPLSNLIQDETVKFALTVSNPAGPAPTASNLTFFLNGTEEAATISALGSPTGSSQRFVLHWDAKTTANYPLLTIQNLTLRFQDSEHATSWINLARIDVAEWEGKIITLPFVSSEASWGYYVMVHQDGMKKEAVLVSRNNSVNMRYRGPKTLKVTNENGATSDLQLPNVAIPFLKIAGTSGGPPNVVEQQDYAALATGMDVDFVFNNGSTKSINFALNQVGINATLSPGQAHFDRVSLVNAVFPFSTGAIIRYWNEGEWMPWYESTWRVAASAGANNRTLRSTNVLTTNTGQLKTHGTVNYLVRDVKITPHAPGTLEYPGLPQESVTSEYDQKFMPVGAEEWRKIVIKIYPPQQHFTYSKGYQLNIGTGTTGGAPPQTGWMAQTQSGSTMTPLTIPANGEFEILATDTNLYPQLTSPEGLVLFLKRDATVDQAHTLSLDILPKIETNSPVRLGALNLLPVEFSVYPVAEDSDDAVGISADDAEQELAAVILVPDMSQGAQSGSLIEAEDGTVIEWELTEGNGTISTQQTTTTDGVAVTTLTTSTTPRDTYKIEAKVTTLKWNGDSFDLGDTGLVTESDLLEVVPGKAATIEAIKSKVEYSSDATDEVEIEITVKDQHENLLADGTPLTWILDKSTGGFAKNNEGEEEIESKLINGKAKVSLRAPTMPVDQNLIVIVDGLTEEIPMTVNRVTGSISSSAASLDVHIGGNATITVNASAADETPVYWFTSNGSITPEAGSLSSGHATATLSTTGGRIEKTVVTATVGDRMFIWEGNFTSSAPVQVSFENPFLIGGVQPGGEPPQNGNGDDYKGPWFILTKGMIRAPGFGGYPATVTVPNGGALVQVTGLDGNSQIMLDQNGYAEFQVAAVGTPNQFGRINIQVQVNPPGAAYVEIVETTPWTHVGDFFGGLIGLDTSTGTGVVTSIVGGYIIVGDVGAIVKNSVRNAGWSDKEPNNFELAMAGAGILGTFSGPGDGIVSAVRVIIQRIGNSPLTDVLWRIAKRIITEGKLPSGAEKAFITMMKNDEVFSQFARYVLTDDRLFSQAARGLDKLGDPFANAVKHAANTNGIGIETAQKIVDAVGNLSDDALDGLKNSGKLDDALSGITKAVDIGVNPKALANTLNNPNALTVDYKQADLLADTKTLIDNSPGIKILKEQFAEMATQAASSRQGRTFEMLVAARRSSVEAITNLPGKSAASGRYFIDIDFESAASLYQVKRTANALIKGDSASAIAKLRASKKLADDAGKAFKYVLEQGEKAKLPQSFLDDAMRKGVEIIEVAFTP